MLTEVEKVEMPVERVLTIFYETHETFCRLPSAMCLLPAQETSVDV